MGVYEFPNISAVCEAEEKDDVSHFVINFPQECLVAKCGAEVTIYNNDKERDKDGRRSQK